MHSIFKPFLLFQLVVACGLALEGDGGQAASSPPLAASPQDKEQPTVAKAPELSVPSASLEPRIGDKNFIADILNRLHSLDTDIGKLLFNSSSMYAADDQSIAFKENQPKGGERFTEVLNDMDALQDELGVLINNATRTRQYNILIRLRPLNTILYRIRHNLHLMRNSLVTINAIAGLERVGNEVMDSTLKVFLQPDANESEELGDDGNYDIDLNKPNSLVGTNRNSTTPLATTTSATSTTTTTTTTTTPPPTSTTTTTTTSAPSRRITKAPNRRNNTRNNQRRTTSRTTMTNTTTTSVKPLSAHPRE